VLIPPIALLIVVAWLIAPVTIDFLDHKVETDGVSNRWRLHPLFHTTTHFPSHARQSHNIDKPAQPCSPSQPVEPRSLEPSQNADVPDDALHAASSSSALITQGLHRPVL